MIVFSDPSRRGNLIISLSQFGRQKWPYKEAVIINATDQELDYEHVDCDARIINVKAKYLGELKNLALYNAKGEWVFPWPDDVEVSTDYIGFHMLRRSKAIPTVIQNPMAHVVKDAVRISVEPELATFYSFFRFGVYIYDQDGSDWRFIQKYPEANMAEAPEGTATRFFEDYAI